jgi:hypothetical protein
MYSLLSLARAWASCLGYPKPVLAKTLNSTGKKITGLVRDRIDLLSRSIDGEIG